MLLLSEECGGKGEKRLERGICGDGGIQIRYTIIDTNGQHSFPRDTFDKNQKIKNQSVSPIQLGSEKGEAIDCDGDGKRKERKRDQLY